MNTPTSLPSLIKYPNTISYLDGSETLLYNIISEPYFDELSAWHNRSNWAIYYHLSPLRKNVLSWINYGDKPLRILELGAGCGAITSYLTTIPNAEIVAVEGSLERARVIQVRCKGAKNLTIHSCSIDAYEPNSSFDIITFIGVLEYSGKYAQGKDPFSSVLKKAAGWLSEKGSLIVAIENQLGCKYISGCAEDHYGVPFEGINRYPHYNGVRTFTKSGLSEKLTNAGLPLQSWYYPYPDYKLPSLVFSDLAFSNPAFDFMALTDVPPEPNENVNPSFSDRSFLSLVGEVTSVSSFMNSFLVVAYKNENSDFSLNNSDIMAVKFNVKFRSKPFQTSTVFKTKDNQLTVTKERLYPDCPMPQCDISINLPQSPEPYYSKTTNAFDALVNFVLQNDSEKAFNLIKLWTDILNQSAITGNEEMINRFLDFSRSNFGAPLYTESYGGLWIKGSNVDLTPLNILIPSQESPNVDQCKIIDLEWQIPCNIPLQLVFDRGMTLLIDKLYRIIKTHKISTNPTTLLPEALHSRLTEFPLFQSMNKSSLLPFESWFQHTIMGTVKLPQLDHYVETVVTFVEQGKNIEALEYFDKYRKFFTGIPDLKQFDRIIESIREKMYVIKKY